MSFSLPFLVCITLPIQSEEMNGFDNFDNAVILKRLIRTVYRYGVIDRSCLRNFFLTWPTVR